MVQNLPTLGVGVSVSLGARPDPVALLQLENGPQFIEYAGLVDVASIQHEIARIHAIGAPVLFHPSYINFCGTFENSRKWLSLTQQHLQAVNSPWFAQDCAYCFWGDGHGYSTQLGYFVPPIFNRATLDSAVERLLEVKRVISSPLAIEPPPVVFAAGNIELLDFFGEIARKADCYVLLDMGHLVSWEKATGKKIMNAISRFPVERVIELHIAGGKIQQSHAGEMYVDAHECAILPESWNMFKALLPLLPNVKAVCYECEGIATDKVLDTVQTIKTMVEALSINHALVQKTGNTL